MLIWRYVYMDTNSRTTVILPKKLKKEMQLMCVMTDRRPSDFIRIAIQDKIKELKEKRNDVT